MATEQNLTLREGDDETIAITITPANASDDLTGVASLVVVFKPDACTSDDHEDALVLTAPDVTILDQSPTEVTATVQVPGSYLAEPYDRVWRVYTVGGSGERRTAIYGSVAVLDT